MNVTPYNNMTTIPTHTELIDYMSGLRKEKIQKTFVVLIYDTICKVMGKQLKIFDQVVCGATYRFYVEYTIPHVTVGSVVPIYLELTILEDKRLSENHNITKWPLL